MSCGCTRIYDHNTFPAGDLREYTGRFNAYAEKAARRGFVFELTLEQFADIAKRRCAYCGAEPAMKVRKERVRSESALMNGVDRIDNSIGYVVSNCTPCCTVCNEMKLNRTVDDFLAHVRKVAAFRG